MTHSPSRKDSQQLSDAIGVTEVLGPNGLLSTAITGFTPRDAQLTMAEAITKTISLNAQLIVEAGTGTGKTFGYLIPVLLSGKKAIISTGTKNLQDQLFFKDIPIIKKVLASTSKVMLLKGRANYLCKYRIEESLIDGRFSSRQLVNQLHIIKDWSNGTQEGDIAELTAIPEDSTIWPQVTSTVDNCLGQDCEFYQNCFVIKARQKALQADVIIVNHHLFFADLALQAEGFGELLPGADVIVFDEAHQIAEVSAQFFSTGITGRQILEFARDTELAILQTAKDMQEIVTLTDNLQAAVHALRLSLGIEQRRAPWPLNLPNDLANSVREVKALLQSTEEALKAVAIRSKPLESAWRRSNQLIERFNVLTGDTPENNVHWFETFAQSFTIQITPMIVAEQFRQYLLEKKRAWIFTSATLTVKNSFQLFVETLGLESALKIQLKSPFDYPKQALLYVPRGMPDPKSREYIQSLVAAVLPVLEMTQGRAFLLFTSHKSMTLAAEILPEYVNYPILLQGTAPKKNLLDQFKELPNAILLGTSSFWYGVDVKGDALSCVIIDKLPFAAPEDPILQARIQMLRKQGIDPFYTYQLPQAVLILKQGAGRLIRDATDRGVLMICDPRLVGSRYGDAFLQSLPNMTRTRELTKVREFLTP